MLPLLADGRSVEPIRESCNYAGMTHRRDHFMIAEGQIDGRFSKRLELLGFEVVPSDALILRKRGGVLWIRDVMSGGIVFVHGVDSAEITQMPVKPGIIRSGGSSNFGHHRIAAIPRVARDNKAPLIFRPKAGRKEQNEKKATRHWSSVYMRIGGVQMMMGVHGGVTCRTVRVDEICTFQQVVVT